MKMKFFISAILLLLSLAATSQDSVFKLKDYKYRVPNFQSLALSGSLSDWYNNNKTNLGEKNASNNFRTSINVDYYQMVSTDRSQFNSSVFFTPQFISDTYKTDTSKSKTSRIHNNLNFGFTNRRFFKKDYFFETGNSLSSNYEFMLSKFQTNKTIVNKILLDDELSVGIGKGRIENVQDAQMALFIINDLQQQGLLRKKITSSTVNELAKLITAVNNRRIFDARKKRIYEFTQIDSFFRKSQLVSQPDMRYFTTINDNWVMAYKPLRSSGTSYYVRVKPGFSTDQDYLKYKQQTVTSEKTFEKVFSYYVKPQIGFEKYVPVNLNWQKNLGASLSFTQKWVQNQNKELSGIDVIKSKSESRDISLNAYYEMGYFPNNRTTVYAGIKLNSNYRFKTEYSSFLKIEPSAYLNADYFISYRTRISFYLSLNHYYYNSNIGNQSTAPLLISNSFSANLNVGFTHSIF